MDKLQQAKQHLTQALALLSEFEKFTADYSDGLERAISALADEAIPSVKAEIVWQEENDPEEIANAESWDAHVRFYSSSEARK